MVQLSQSYVTTGKTIVLTTCLDRDLIPLGIKYKNLHVHLYCCRPVNSSRDKSEVRATVSHSVTSGSLWLSGPQRTRLLCPWDSAGKNTGVGCCTLLHGIFPTQGSNPGLLHCRWIFYHLSPIIIISNVKKKKKTVDISHFFPILSPWNSVCVLNLQISRFKQAAFPVLCSHTGLGGYHTDRAALENKSEGLQWKQQPSLEATAKVQWDKHCSD